MTPAAVAVIRAAALRNNLQKVRELAPGCRILAVVKANGYGHGLVAVARILAGADALGVARIEEGLQLRDAGIDRRIVVLGGFVGADELHEAARHRLDLVLHNPEQLGLLEDAGLPADIWVKLDTGMGRLGIEPAFLAGALDRLRTSVAGGTIRLMTHLAAADAPGSGQTSAQLAVFADAAAGWQGDISIANSAAILRSAALPAVQSAAPGASNWVRPGLMLYGASPLPDRTAADLGLQPAMSFETRLVAVKRLARGQRVGYGGDWQAERDSVVGVAAAGYADGYPWHSARGTPVLVNGRPAQVIGRISMDMISIDLTGLPVAAPGDRVLLWGDGLPVEEVARHAGTIPWVLLTGVGQRVLRQVSD